MTTAARPTWAPALGGNSIRDNKSIPATRQFSSRDLAAHTKLKLRQGGQNTLDELYLRDLKAELLEKEKVSKQKRMKERGIEITDEEEIKPRKMIEEAKDKDEYKDIDKDDSASESESEEDDEESDSEDDTAELLRELEKIKKEREAERMRLEKEQEQLEEQEKEEKAMTGNPLLLNGGGGNRMKKRWYDDVVFKNQAKGFNDKPRKRFINDILRSDFHKKFMDKYVK